jgi:hypothetical protein
MVLTFKSDMFKDGFGHQAGRSEQSLLGSQNRTIGLPGSCPWRMTGNAALEPFAATSQFQNNLVS